MQDINIFSPWLMVNIAILMAVTQFCGCKPNSVDKCVENFVFVSRDTLSLFLPMLKEEALNLHAHKKVSSLLVHHCSRDIPVFQEVAQLSQNKNLRYAEMLRKRALIFALLSVFLRMSTLYRCF